MKYDIRDETVLHSYLLTSGATSAEGECVDYLVQLVTHVKNAFPCTYKKTVKVYKTLIDCEIERLSDD